MTSEDHLVDMAQGAQVIQRVFPDGDHVSALALFDAAGDVINAGNLSVAQGSGVQGEAVGDADVLVEVLQFPPEVVVGYEVAAGIIAKADRDVVFQAGLGAVDEAVKNDAAVAAGDFRSPAFGQFEFGVGDGRGRVQMSAAFLSLNNRMI